MDLLVFESSCHPSTTHSETHCTFLLQDVKQRSCDVNTNFNSLWFDPTENRIQVYGFSSRYLSTDRYYVFHWVFDPKFKLNKCKGQ